jgi:formate dehydrogenase accessory protein FdhE
MPDSWDRRINRTVQLASRDDDAAQPLVAFYGILLRLQKELYDFLRSRPGWRPTGALDRDLAVLRPQVPAFLRGVAAAGSARNVQNHTLAREASLLLEGPGSAIDELLLNYWRDPSDRQFFPKAILQPYAQWLSEQGVSPAGRPPTGAENRCPRCGGAPQLATLEVTSDPMADGGGRSLLCALCLTSWPFRRVLCASCGETDERKLAYFKTASYDHLRVDACDTCRRYVKTVDLTRLGLAVPIVDELAGAPLDLWAREHDYQKVELNLVGV